MAQLVGLIVSEDDAFKKHFGRLLRAGAIPVSVHRRARRAATATPPDLVIVDTRGDASSSMSSIERLRAGAAGAGIFAIAPAADPDLILQSMRAGANEFFTWPPDEETFHGAVRRTAARRETAQGARPSATTLVFFGAKGGAGTTTVSVNCGVELARLSKQSTVIVDLKPGLGEVALFLGMRPRYSLLDAIDNLHRLDREFLKELVVKHKSGLEILAGSDQFDRPGAADGGAIEELFRLLARQYQVHPRRLRQPDQLVHGRRALHRRHDLPGRQPGRAVDSQLAAAARPRAPARRVRRARARAAQPRRRSRIRFRRSRSKARSATRFTTRSRATTRPCRPRSTRACRSR